MKTTYKQPGKIKISRETRVDFIDLIDYTLTDIATQNYTDPKISTDDPSIDNVLDLNDLYREIQGAEYLIGLLKIIKDGRTREVNKLLKKIKK
jgi:hypothetical protein